MSSAWRREGSAPTYRVRFRCAVAGVADTMGRRVIDRSKESEVKEGEERKEESESRRGEEVKRGEEVQGRKESEEKRRAQQSTPKSIPHSPLHFNSLHPRNH